MKGQWGLILGIIAALFISIFAVINVEAVRVNYLFGTAEWPLILVILSSVLMGGILVGAVGMVKVYRLQNEIRRLNRNDNSEKPSIEKNEKRQIKPVSDQEIKGKKTSK